jgi:hypothetical protein
MGDEALESAFRALGHRDRSTREIDRRLADQGFSEDERLEALATLERTVVVDDLRFARARAAALAARGSGDERIRFELDLGDWGVCAGIAVVKRSVLALRPEGPEHHVALQFTEVGSKAQALILSYLLAARRASR